MNESFYRSHYVIFTGTNVEMETDGVVYRLIQIRTHCFLCS